MKQLLIFLIFIFFGCSATKKINNNNSPCTYRGFNESEYLKNEKLLIPLIRRTTSHHNPAKWDSLKVVADFLVKNKELVVELRSHTDFRDTDENNLKLSYRWAVEYCNTIIKIGELDSNRITAIGMGESEPFVVDYCTKNKYPDLFEVGETLNRKYIMNMNVIRDKEIAHSINRRNEIVIINTSNTDFNSYEKNSYSILNDIDEKYYKKFEYLLNKRDKTNLKLRMNNSNYDYLFIEEHYYTYHVEGYCKVKYDLQERYFNKYDSIPFKMIANGDNVDVKVVYCEKYKGDELYNTKHKELNPLIHKYSKLNKIQEYDYEKNQFMFFLPKEDFKKSWYKRERKKAIKGEYTILTMVDRVNHRIIISFQLPPKKPKFDLRMVSFERVL